MKRVVEGSRSVRLAASALAAYWELLDAGLRVDYSPYLLFVSGCTVSVVFLTHCWSIRRLRAVYGLYSHSKELRWSDNHGGSEVLFVLPLFRAGALDGFCAIARRARSIHKGSDHNGLWRRRSDVLR